MQQRWQAGRAGVFHYWNYDEQEFIFVDGKLLLRGGNGAGKSVTMQSFYPLLLDGSTKASRLDPFASNSRTIKGYLLGDNSNADEEKTGYVFVEYQKAGSHGRIEYFTTGMGIQYKPNMDPKFWYFCVNGKRVNRDFFLYEENALSQLKTPLDRRQLGEEIGTDGTVFVKQEDYKEHVNKHLFGFEDIEAYDGLIKLLVQIRSPKLTNSKDFKPTSLYEILSNSLPELTNEELSPLSETIDSIDNVKENARQVENDLEKLTKVCVRYAEYNKYVLADKAKELADESEILDREVKTLEDEFFEHKQKTEEYQSKAEELEKLDREQESLQTQYNSLKSEKDLEMLESDLSQVTQRLKEYGEKLKSESERLEKKKQEERKAKERYQQLDRDQESKDKEILDYLDELDDLSYDAVFSGDHQIESDYFIKGYKKNIDSMVMWKRKIGSHGEWLQAIQLLIRNHKNELNQKDALEIELGELNKKNDDLKEELENLENVLNSEKDQLVAAIEEWQKECSELHLNPFECQEVMDLIYDALNIVESDKFKEIVQAAYLEQKNRKSTELANAHEAYNRKDKEFKKKQEEVEQWRSMVDPEPERAAEITDLRRHMSLKYDFAPFYNVVEFKKGVKDEVKDAIETALTEAGLLDALVVAAKDMEYLATVDKVIQSQPIEGKTLADYLYATVIQGSRLTETDIDRALRSIAVDEESASTMITTSGHYQIGILKGTIYEAKKSVYIGKEQRRKFREDMIAKLEEEAEILRDELEQLGEIFKELGVKSQLLDQEFANLPDNDGIKDLFSSMEKVKAKISANQENIERQKGKINQVILRISTLQNEISQKSLGINLRKDELSYSDAVKAANDYSAALNDLHLAYNDFSKIMENLKLEKLRLETLQEEIEEFGENVGDYKVKISRENARKEAIEETMDQLGFKEIKEELNRLKSRLDDIPEKQNKIRDERAVLKSRIGDLENSQTIRTKRIEFFKQIVSSWKEAFLREEKLAMVDAGEPSADTSDVEVIKRAKNIRSKSKDLLASKTKPIDGVIDTYSVVRNDLTEYNMELKPENRVFTIEAPEEVYNSKVDILNQKSGRHVLVGYYEGRMISPFSLKEKLEKRVEQYKLLFEEQQTKLWEEILIQSLGDKIREKIDGVNDWVHEMNILMGSGNYSSNLKLHLKWVPKQRENEDELSTTELVKYLRTSSGMIKEDDRKRFVKHFSIKIDQARRMTEDSTKRKDLHDAIKEVVDYRNWFTFELHFEKDNKEMKALSNHKFGEFSGGEKVLSMYIPLFTAVYSKYIKASPNAPRIITLDEAFAGVDEDNISEGFDLIEKLGFGYIVNSQALWGCYETVKGLSIYELNKAKSAGYVTCIQYKWNGINKEIVTDLSA